MLSTEEGHHAAQLLLGHLVNSRQVLQDDVHRLVVRHGCEEEGTIAPRAGGQQDTLAAGKAMLG